jgi:phosphoglycerate kinase
MGLPTIEDLPDAAGTRVLLRATLDLPLSTDTDRPLARARAEGLASTVRWFAERGAQVSVWGSPCFPPPGDIRADARADDRSRAPRATRGRLPHVRAVVRELEPVLARSPAIHVRSCTEDSRAVDRMVSAHDVFVNDSLQDSLLPLPSVMLPPARLPSAIGRTLQRDLDALEPLVTAPGRPFVVVLGGERTYQRLHGLVGLVLRADAVLLGGGLARAMLQAVGREPRDGADDDFLSECREVLGLAQRVRHRLVLPDDLVWSRDGPARVSRSRVHEGDQVVDIGPATCVRFAEELQGAAAVLWAGSVGRVEREASRAGTRALAAALRASQSIVIGGDALVDLLFREHLLPAGASLLTSTDSAIELLKNGGLPALAAIRDRAARLEMRTFGERHAPRAARR